MDRRHLCCKFIIRKEWREPPSWRESANVDRWRLGRPANQMLCCTQSRCGLLSLRRRHRLGLTIWVDALFHRCLLFSCPCVITFGVGELPPPIRRVSMAAAVGPLLHGLHRDGLDLDHGRGVLARRLVPALFVCGGGHALAAPPTRRAHICGRRHEVDRWWLRASSLGGFT